MKMTISTVSKTHAERCCSFCAKNQEQVKLLIAGLPSKNNAIYICDECVAQCNKIVSVE